MKIYDIQTKSPIPSANVLVECGEFAYGLWAHNFTMSFSSLSVFKIEI